jgi:diguanylate cyclase (GGDEF)-like protein
MTQWAKGLRAQLLALVLVAVIPAFGLIGYDAISERRDSVAQAERDAINLVRLAAREHSDLLDNARQLVLSLSKSPRVMAPRTAASCNEFLAEVLRLHPYYANLGVATTHGTLYCSALPFPKPTSIADRSYFRRALASGAVGVGDYQTGRVTQVPSINIGHAVLDRSGQVQAVVFVALNLRWLNELIAHLDLRQGSAASVFDSNGTVLAHYPDPQKWVGKSQEGSRLVNTIFRSKAEGTTEAPGIDGVNRLYAFAPLPDNVLRGVYVSVGISKEVAAAAANEAFVRSLVGLLIVVALGIIGAWYASGASILRRINALTAAARRIRAGDLTPPNLVHGSGELGELSRGFEEMAGALYRINRAHKTLSETKRVVLCATEERALLAEMCRLIVRQVGYRGALLGYAGQDERGMLVPMAQEGFLGGMSALRKNWQNVSWAEGSGPTATAIRTGKPYVAQYLLTDPNFSPWREDAIRHGVASLAVFPTAVDGRVIGALAIYAAEPNAFEPGELNLLAEAVQDLSVGIALLRARAEQGRANATIERMAHYDRLTGLPNHALFEQRLRAVLSQARSFDRTLGLFIIDITRLRDVNDVFGFHSGDVVVREVAMRIGRALGPDAIFARMRSDEFALLCPVANVAEAAGVAERITDAASAPFEIGTVKVDINLTVGISLYPAHGKDSTLLMRHADVAMYEAKKSATRCMFYRHEQDENRARRLAMVGELRHAIEANQLVLHYQPKVSVRDRRVCGFEALVRWMHPERGLVPPDEFIALAEQSGLIRPLTDWVIAKVLQQSAGWRRRGLALPIAVNLSVYNLRDPCLIQKLEQSLQEFDAAANWLELEITEGAVMDDPSNALEILRRLREIGITLFVDDFGTGYSSLGYLKKLPVDAVKIDKSFVIDMTDDQDSEAIVRATINLGHELGLNVVAEGVESGTAFDHLAALRCDVAQGYFIGEPMLSADLHGWLDQGLWPHDHGGSEHGTSDNKLLRRSARTRI